ncbi:MAG: hypothetical protein HUK02_05405 [Bacteroidaceae bacterium]|nr:hypothetical protein [Bacteroidaceae bacterium]
MTPKEKIQGRLHRVDREIMKTVFVPKGTWMAGATISYTDMDIENINLLVLKDVTADGHTYGINPCVGYFVKDNVGIGAHLNYSRTYAFLGNLDLDLGEDFNISLKDLYYLQNDFKASFFVRTYMPLTRGKIFAFYSDIRFSYGHHSGKNSTGRYELGNLDASYTCANSLNIGFAPGLTAFVQDWMAVEVQAGVMGFGFKWSDQTTNQVESGHNRTMTGKFKVDLFSIAIGTAFYF